MDRCDLVELMVLARQYLNHPDVTALPFVVNSGVVADRLQEAIDELAPNPVDRLKQGYEKIAESRPLVQPKQYGRRSSYGYSREG